MSKIEIALISWDCSFRNFYGGVESLDQDSIPDDVNLSVYIVEQRSKSTNAAYHDKWGTEQCEVLAKRLRKVNLKVIYLDDFGEYDISMLLGAGLKAAQANNPAIIGIFDCDQIFPSDFINICVEETKHRTQFVFNLSRIMASKPHGTSFDNWLSAKRDHYSVMKECPIKGDIVRTYTHNKFPLIMANCIDWNSINLVDYNCNLFSGNATRLGLLINTILEHSAATNSNVFPGYASVHPWHPSGSSKRQLKIAIKLFLQLSAIKKIRRLRLHQDSMAIQHVLEQYNNIYMRYNRLPSKVLRSIFLGAVLLFYMRIARVLRGGEIAQL